MQPLSLISADNDRVVDASGRSYFDLTAGWNVMNAGWNNETIYRDWVDRSRRLPFRPSWCTDANQAALTEYLRSSLAGYSPVYSCSGSEAIDNALKLARLATGRSGVVCVGDAYHGSTLGAALAAGFHVSHLEPLGLDGIRYTLPIPSTDAAITLAEEVLSREEDIGAVVFETVLTNAGCHVVPDRFLELLQRMSQEQGFLLICDEIGTGMSRTGRLWSFEGRGIKPHIVTCGKALTNGLYPLSIALVATELRPFLDDDSFASTYGGTSAACAAALSTIAFHEAAQLPMRARNLGQAVARQLEDCGRRLGTPITADGVGLSIAVDLWGTGWTRARRPDSVVKSLLQRSIFSVLSPDGERLMITPALTANEDALLEALHTVAQTIAEARSGNLG